MGVGCTETVIPRAGLLRLGKSIKHPWTVGPPSMIWPSRPSTQTLTSIPLPLPQETSGAMMAGLSSKLCLLLTVFTAWLNFVVAAGPSVHIKSKTASGTGCPSEHWVDIKVEDNAVALAIQYIDFTPATSPEQPVQFASKSCQVTLELDQLLAGYQFAVTNVTHWASVHFPR